MAHNGANTPARAIHAAVRRGDVDAVRYALAAGTPVDVMEEDSRWTPLMRLCFHAGPGPSRSDEARAVDCAELLLAAGANVDAADGDGDTALAFAAGADIPRVVQLLLDAGANPNAVGGGRWMPLHWAAWASPEGCVECAALLIQHGAAVNAETDQRAGGAGRKKTRYPLTADDGPSPPSSHSGRRRRMGAGDGACGQAGPASAPRQEI